LSLNYKYIKEDLIKIKKNLIKLNINKSLKVKITNLEIIIYLVLIVTILI